MPRKDAELMRSFFGKSILSLVRSGDYAHAGEEEAIDLVFRDIKQDANRKVLDVGCGKGGTAKYIQDHGFGFVTGIDIESASIEFANKTYPDVKFYCADVVDIGKTLTEKFDLICIFNAFYEFPNQETALRALRKVSHDKTILLIFDYIDLSKGKNPIIVRNDRTKTTNPIELQNLDETLSKTGWNKTAYENLHEKYKTWYITLLNKIAEKKESIIINFGEKGYNDAINRYTELLKAITTGGISGGIIKLEFASCYQELQLQL